MVNYDFLYDKEYFRSQFEKSYFVERKLSYLKCENAYVVPYGAGLGVYTDNKQYIACTAMHNGSDISQPSANVSGAEHINETVVYLGVYTTGWGHILTDVIRRFWIFRDDNFLKEYGDSKLVLANWGGARCLGMLKSFLR